MQLYNIAFAKRQNNSYIPEIVTIIARCTRYILKCCSKAIKFQIGNHLSKCNFAH
jgi:hypothetical protein